MGGKASGTNPRYIYRICQRNKFIQIDKSRCCKSYNSALKSLQDSPISGNNEFLTPLNSQSDRSVYECASVERVFVGIELDKASVGDSFAMASAELSAKGIQTTSANLW